VASAFDATTFTVIDTETTGFSPVRDRVVEVAYVQLRAGRLIGRWSTLVDPERDIPPETTAIHGIRDADVAGAPTLSEIRPRLRAATRGTVVVAHNASFDLRFLPWLARRPIICTMRLAMHLVVAPN